MYKIHDQDSVDKLLLDNVQEAKTKYNHFTQKIKPLFNQVILVYH